MSADDDFGNQGGDPRRMVGGVHIDLSTCVNFYGPPPAVLERLRGGLRGEDLQIHPYCAAEQIEAMYARHLGVSASELVAGRGTTEFIWALSRRVPHASVAVPLPGYTDYLKAFPGRGFPGGPVPSIEQIDAALDVASAGHRVQPAQPDGRRAGPRSAASTRRGAIRSRRSSSTSPTSTSSPIRARRPSSARIREPRRPALAVEVLGNRRDPRRRRVVPDRERLARLLGRRETWPISGVDVAVAEAAMASVDWAERARLDLAATPPGSPTPARAARRARRVGVDVHYRCLVTRTPPSTRVLARHGVGVRVLGRAHGAEPGMLRVLAPLPHQRAAVAACGAIPAGSRPLRAERTPAPALTPRARRERRNAGPRGARGGRRPDGPGAIALGCAGAAGYGVTVVIGRRLARAASRRRPRWRPFAVAALALAALLALRGVRAPGRGAVFSSSRSARSATRASRRSSTSASSAVRQRRASCSSTPIPRSSASSAGSRCASAGRAGAPASRSPCRRPGRRSSRRRRARRNRPARVAFALGRRSSSRSTSSPASGWARRRRDVQRRVGRRGRRLGSPAAARYARRLACPDRWTLLLAYGRSPRPRSR